LIFGFYTALRYVQSGRNQTILMLCLVMVGVTAYTFITATVQGIQSDVIRNSLGSSSHVTIEPFDDLPIVDRTIDRGQVLSTIQTGQQREKKISDWPSEIARLGELPEITVISPAVLGSGFVERGTQSRPVSIRGGEPELMDLIVNIKKDLVEGVFDLSAGKAVIGITLAKKLNVSVSDRVRVISNRGVQTNVQIAGIVYAGNPIADESTIYVTLGDAQRLLRLDGSISAIEVKVKNVFDAAKVAEILRQRVKLKCTPWMENNTQVLTLISSQNIATGVIRAFALLSVALGIASVLNVTVTQKGKEIGIIKSMGAVQSQVLYVFIFLGGFIGLLGGLAGAFLSYVLNAALKVVSANTQKGAPSFATDFQMRQVWEAVIVAVLVAVIGAYIPARKASKLDPVEAIRGV